LGALGVAAFYVVTILVPWLGGEQGVHRREKDRQVTLHPQVALLQKSSPHLQVSVTNVSADLIMGFRVELRGPDGGKVVLMIDERGTVLAQASRGQGPKTIDYSEPRVAVG